GSVVSGPERLLAAHQGSHHRQGIVEDDDVGDGSGGEGAQLGTADQLGGDAGGAGHGPLERGAASVDEVADRGVHGQHTPGDGPVFESHLRAGDEQALAPDGVLAVGEAGGGDGIGDESHPLESGVHDDLHRVEVEMDAVGDDAQDHVAAGQGGERDPRVPVVHRALGVEQMGHGAGSGVEGGVGGGGVGVGMADGDDDPAGDQAGYQLEGPG